MGLFEKDVFWVMIIMACCGVLSMGEVYKVGDSAGWTNVGNVDYKAWSATKNFHVGDTIVFKYNHQFQNILRVTHKNFKSCNATTPYYNDTFNTGNDSFIIRRTGHFYFICSFPGHCQAGQKVDIRVPPSPGPTLSPSPAPSGPRSWLSPPPSPSPLPPSPPPSFRWSWPTPPPSPSVSGPHNSDTSLHLTKGVVASKLLLSLVVLAFCASGIVY